MAHRYFETTDLSEKYKQYRPRPPQGLIDRVKAYLKEKHTGKLELAVDVGCGTGQNTYYYADIFAKVLGTDVSPSQIAEAKKDNTRSNVSFEVGPAEAINVPDGSVQLLTVMSAVHWFDHPKFFAEGLRVLSPGGVMALYGYSTFILEWDRNPERNAALKEAMEEYINNSNISAYWAEPFRKYVAVNCTNIRIPYDDYIREDSYSCSRQISLADVLMCLQTWSAFATLIEKEGREAGGRVLEDLKNTLLNIVKDDLHTNEDSENKILFTEITPYFLMLARKPRSL